METLERFRKDVGGGLGNPFFTSDLFIVTHWDHHNAKTSTLEVKPFWGSSFQVEFDRIRFEGHVLLVSDQNCFNQLTPDEILRMMESVRISAFKEGERSKLVEIQTILGLN